MFKSGDVTLCTSHGTIIYWSKEIKKDLKKVLKLNPQYSSDFEDVFKKLNLISEEARSAKRKGQHMENRLKKYRTAVESLGFKRTRR